MQSARLFVNGKSQVANLPEEFAFSGNEVRGNNIGDIAFLFPNDKAWENFMNCEPASDDFGDAIFDERHNNVQSPREEL